MSANRYFGARRSSRLLRAGDLCVEMRRVSRDMIDACQHAAAKKKKSVRPTIEIESPKWRPSAERLILNVNVAHESLDAKEAEEIEHQRQGDVQHRCALFIADLTRASGKKD